MDRKPRTPGADVVSGGSRYQGEEYSRSCERHFEGFESEKSGCCEFESRTGRAADGLLMKQSRFARGKVCEGGWKVEWSGSKINLRSGDYDALPWQTTAANRLRRLSANKLPQFCCSSTVDTLSLVSHVTSRTGPR